VLFRGVKPSRRRAMAGLVLVLLAVPAAAAPVTPAAPPFIPAPDFALAGPAKAQGAVVWLHGSYDTDQPPPALPVWLGRLHDADWDVWRFDRVSGHDPLAPGGAMLADGVAKLRADGYRRIIVAGHSRGGWIALSILAHPGLADAVAAFSPAAHGPRPEQRPRAMAAWQALLDTMQPAHTRLMVVTWRDDPFDPDPATRLAELGDRARQAGYTLSVIDRPPAPTGHMGLYDPGFDAQFGACTAGFLQGGAPCP
jgi:pimeloyl-ACP methyl ester carboxylesterase